MTNSMPLFLWDKGLPSLKLVFHLYTEMLLHNSVGFQYTFFHPNSLLEYNNVR